MFPNFCNEAIVEGSSLSGGGSTIITLMDVCADVSIECSNLMMTGAQVGNR